MSRPDWRVTRADRPDPWSLVTRGELSDLSHAVSPRACMVWLFLDTFADRDGAGAYPWQWTIAHGLGCNRRTVVRALAELRRAGWVSSRWEQVATEDGRKRQRLVYELHHSRAVAPRREVHQRDAG